MNGQKFLHDTLNTAIEGGLLDGCDYFADTDYVSIPQDKSYAVIISEKPFDFRQVARNAAPSGRLEEYVVHILLLYKPDSDITNENYLVLRDKLQAEAVKIVNAVYDAAPGYNKISKVTTGKADAGIMPVGSRNFLWIPVPFVITTIN